MSTGDPPLYADAVQHADALLDACAALRRELVTYERAVRRTRARVTKGVLSPVPTVIPELICARERVNDRFAEFERCRRRWRTAFFNLQSDAGMSQEAIAREWGLSRQLVSRLMNSRPEANEQACG